MKIFIILISLYGYLFSVDLPDCNFNGSKDKLSVYSSFYKLIPNASIGVVFCDNGTPALTYRCDGNYDNSPTTKCQGYYYSITKNATCPSGQVLNNGFCIPNPVCPSGSVYDADSNQCISCPPGSVYSDLVINGVPGGKGCISCPPSQISNNNVCSPCATNQIATNNTCSSCPQYSHPENNLCVLPSYPDYDDDVEGCKSHGGWNQVKLGGSFLKPSVGTKCVSKDETLDDYLALILGFSPAGGYGVLGDMGKWALNGLKNKLSSLAELGSKDLEIGLPKVEFGVDGFTRIQPTIKETPTPITSAPKIEVDPNLLHLRPEYFPPNAAGEAEVNMANIDRWNRDNLGSRDNNVDPINNTYNNRTLQTDITSRISNAQPIAEVLNFPMIIQNPNAIANVKPIIKDYPAVFNNPSYFPAPEVPQVVATVPVTRTVQNTTTSNGLPVQQIVNEINYPDGSKLHEKIELNPTYNVGRITSTTTSPSGTTSTTSQNFSAPKTTLPGQPDFSINLGSPDLSYDAHIKITKTSPVSTIEVPLTANAADPFTPLPKDPITGLPVADPALNPAATGLPTTASGQDLINAAMPAYAFPSLADFTPFKLSDVTEIITNGSVMINNVNAQLNTAKASFDTTKTLIMGG